jgi:hypothetical protein
MIRIATVFIMSLFPTLAMAQVVSSTQHVFPWFVDGRVDAGASYRTELVISNPNSVYANCGLQLAGLRANFEALNGPVAGPISILNFAVFPAGYEVLRTVGSQPLATGYAVLNCSVDVYATSRFAFFDGGVNSSPIAEATAPSSFGNTIIEYVYDNRNGARLGIAIANPYPTPTVFALTVLGSLTGVWYLTVSAGSVATRFLDEWVPLPANATGKVIIRDYYSSRNVYSIGLKYSGQTFTSVFPNVRAP